MEQKKTYLCAGCGTISLETPTRKVEPEAPRQDEADTEAVWKATKGINPETGEMWLTPRMIRSAEKLQNVWEKEADPASMAPRQNELRWFAQWLNSKADECRQRLAAIKDRGKVDRRDRSDYLEGLWEGQEVGFRNAAREAEKRLAAILTQAKGELEKKQTLGEPGAV